MTKEAACETGSCSTGCGGGGRLCPGIALLFSFTIGSGLGAVTGLSWLMPVCTVAGTLLLSTGLYRYLNPFRLSWRNRSSQA